MLSNPSEFFADVRGFSLFGARLDQSEVDGINSILEACQGLPVSHVAYVLATAYHETGGAMQPVKERGSDAYFFRMYDPFGARPKVAARLGNTQRGDGVRFCGRGLPQTTGRANYLKASRFLGVDCVANPDLLLRTENAARWTVHAMVHGVFTGRKLSDDLPASGAATHGQFVKSRDTINGHDLEDRIADVAMDFQTALIVGGWRP